jgi:hypothetical protein
VARLISIQSNFSSGEMDPLLRARIDINQYYNALAKATNVIIQPQGGLKRRFGTKFLTEIPSAATPADGVRCVEFEFSVDDSYMLVFAHNRMYVFKDKALVEDINGVTDQHFLDTTAVGLTSARVALMCWTQSADTMIITQQGVSPIKLVRGATDATWTISTIAFDSVPRYAFSLNTTEPAQTLTPSAVSGNVTLTAGGNVFHDGLTGTCVGGGASTITLPAGASADNDIYNGATITLTGGTGSGQTRIISDYDGGTKIATVSTAWTTQPVSSDTTFEILSQVGQYINAEPQGRAKIISVTSATVVNARVEYPFFSASAIASGSWEIEFGYEDVWSATRGYPRAVTFHEGRLYFAGSTSRPSTVWGSKVGLFFDFDPTSDLDDDAVEATLDTNQLNVINDIISGRDLQIFTSGGEFYVPQEGLNPITPTTFFIKTASRNGSKAGIRVQQLESGTLFIQRQGEAINEFLFSDTQLAYVTNKISLLSGHLLKTPAAMALRRGTNNDEGDLLCVVNSGDGTIAVWTILRSQNVIAPAEFTTDGEYVAVGVDVTDIYTIVKRTIGGSDVYYVEVFDDTYFTDCGVRGGVASSVSVTHLAGETVNVILDGLVQSDETADASSGLVTFDRASTESYEVGLEFNPLAKTMPVEPKLQVGPRTGFKKRIVEVNVIVKDTQHLKINNQLVPFRAFDADVLDEPEPEFTGIKTLHGILGYSTEAQITIEQEAPLKFNLLGLEYRVSVHQGS